MAKNYDNIELTKIRRKDRAVEDDLWIKEYLRKSVFASIASLYGDQPFINSNIYVYDEEKNAIYFHTAKQGRTRHNAENSKKVCFSISEIGRMLPADVALEFSCEYKGVIVFGELTIIENEAEAKYALQLLLDKYFGHLKPGKDYREIIPEELKRTTVYKIGIDKWSGKQKQVEEFEGAFYYKN